MSEPNDLEFADFHHDYIRRVVSFTTKKVVKSYLQWISVPITPNHHLSTLCGHINMRLHREGKIERISRGRWRYRKNIRLNLNLFEDSIAEILTTQYTCASHISATEQTAVLQQDELITVLTKIGVIIGDVV